MDTQSKREEKILKELIVQGGLEKSPEDFRARIMDTIERKAEQQIRYRPLISKRAWVVISAITAVLLFLIYNYAGSGTPKLDVQIPFEKIGGILPEIEISRTFIYATLFLSLFLFQIPLLKKYMEPGK